MSEHTSHRHSLTMTHEDTVLQNAELKRELSETRQLLWLAVNEAGLNFFGSHLGHVAVHLTDLPADYEVETFKPDHSPGVVVITARRTNFPGQRVDPKGKAY